MRQFQTLKQCAERIDEYFVYIQGESHIEKKEENGKITDIIVWDRKPEPALFTGLALFMGFSSKAELEKQGSRGRYKKLLKQARLRIELEYEKRVLQQSPTGAIFVLKTLGWREKPADQLERPPKKLKIEIVTAGPSIAGAEKDVAL